MNQKRTPGTILFGIFFIVAGIIFLPAHLGIKASTDKMITYTATTLDMYLNKLKELGNQHKEDLIKTNRWDAFNDKAGRLEYTLQYLKKQIERNEDIFNTKPTMVISFIVGLLYLTTAVAVLWPFFWARYAVFTALAVNTVFYLCVVFVTPISIGNLMNTIGPRFQETINLVQSTAPFQSQNLAWMALVKFIPVHLIFMAYTFGVWYFFTRPHVKMLFDRH